MCLQSYDVNTAQSASYAAFCRDVADLLSRYPNVLNHARLVDSIAWLRSIL